MTNYASINIDLHVIDEIGNQGFHLACANGHDQVINVFIKQSEGQRLNFNAMNQDGNTGFHLACSKGHGNIVDTYFATGSNIQRQEALREESQIDILYYETKITTTAKKAYFERKKCTLKAVFSWKW